MRNLASMIVCSALLFACGKGAGGTCAVDSDCKSGRNCWCDPAKRDKNGVCGTVGKDEQGECLSDQEFGQRVQAAPGK